MDEAEEVDYLADEMSKILVIEGEEIKTRRNFDRYLKETNIPRYAKIKKTFWGYLQKKHPIRKKNLQKSTR